MDYQLVLEFSQFLAFQLGALGLLVVFFFRTGIKLTKNIEEDYHSILKNYRLTGIISYFELNQVFGDYSKKNIFKLIKQRKIKGELERNLCSHIYKSLRFHEQDLEKSKNIIPWIENIYINRIASLNIKSSDFLKGVTKNIEEMLILKSKILNDEISIENTLVLINESSDKSYLQLFFQMMSLEKTSLLVFSFEKLKDFNLQEKFINVAIQKLPYLSQYLVEAMLDSKNANLRLKACSYFLTQKFKISTQKLKNLMEDKNLKIQRMGFILSKSVPRASVKTQTFNYNKETIFIEEHEERP